MLKLLESLFHLSYLVVWGDETTASSILKAMKIKSVDAHMVEFRFTSLKNTCCALWTETGHKARLHYSWSSSSSFSCWSRYSFSQFSSMEENLKFLKWGKFLMIMIEIILNYYKLKSNFSRPLATPSRYTFMVMTRKISLAASSVPRVVLTASSRGRYNWLWQKRNKQSCNARCEPKVLKIPGPRLLNL